MPAHILATYGIEESLALWEKSLASTAQMHFIGGFNQTELIGFAKYGIDPEDASSGYVASLYVDPTQSGRGYGSFLMSHIVKELSTFPTIHLWVFESNLSAITFYSKFGYVPTGRERIEPEWEINQIQLELRNS